MVWAVAELLAASGSGVLDNSVRAAVLGTIVPVGVPAVTLTVIVKVTASPRLRSTALLWQVMRPVPPTAGLVGHNSLAGVRRKVVFGGTVSLSVTVGLLLIFLIRSGPALVPTIV